MYFGKCWLTDPNQQAIKHWEFGLCYKMAGVQSMLPLLVTGKPWASQLNSLGLAFLICSPAQFSRSLVSDSLRPHESQHARPPCPPPTSRVHPDSRPSSQWCHPAISSIMRMLVCLMLSQMSLRLSSFFFILFSIFCFTAVISTTLSSRSLIHSTCDSAVDSF